jgi:uncharacterized membrane protein YcaP (DUF421 family)
MRREYLTQEELMSHLRREGIDDPRRVKFGYVDGKEGSPS